MRAWKKMETGSKTCETFCLPYAIQLHFAWLSNFGYFRHASVSKDRVFVQSLIPTIKMVSKGCEVI